MDEDGLKKFNALEARIQKGLERDTSFLEKVRADAEAAHKEREALRRFALVTGRMWGWLHTGTESERIKGALLEIDEAMKALDGEDAPSGVDILQRAIDEATPKPEPVPVDKTVAECPCPACVMARAAQSPAADRARLEAEAAEVMGTLVSSVLDRATAAVRDEAGSRLCSWTEGGTRVCNLDYGRPCLCRQVALAVIDVLEPGSLDMAMTDAVVQKALRAFYAGAVPDRDLVSFPNHSMVSMRAALEAVARKPEPDDGVPLIVMTDPETSDRLLERDGIIFARIPYIALQKWPDLMEWMSGKIARWPTSRIPIVATVQPPPRDWLVVDTEA